MKLSSAFYLVLLILAISMMVSSCRSNEEPIYTDPQGREIIPCTGGDLCFDPERPDVKAALEEYIETIEYVTGLPINQEWIQSMSDGFRACNIYRGSAGLVQVDCPDWVEWPPCPPKFFQVLAYSVVASRKVPNRYYCLGEDAPPTSFCDWNLSCADGLVCTGEATKSWRDIIERGTEEWPPECVTPDACATIAELEGISISEKTCFYSDFTTLKTGVVPEQPCGSVAQGSCAVNCACDPVEHPFINAPIDTCRFVSEAHPVGLCVGARCEADENCFVAGSVCAHLRTPAWVESYAVGLEASGGGREVVPGTYWTGYCAMRSTCEAWSAANPGVIERCGD